MWINSSFKMHVIICKVVVSIISWSQCFNWWQFTLHNLRIMISCQVTIHKPRGFTSGFWKSFLYSEIVLFALNYLPIRSVAVCIRIELIFEFDSHIPSRSSTLVFAIFVVGSCRQVERVTLTTKMSISR